MWANYYLQVMMTMMKFQCLVGVGEDHQLLFSNYIGSYTYSIVS